MAKAVTERDILAEMMAAQPPDRPPGWYTCDELSKALGVGNSVTLRRLKAGVRDGTYEAMEARVRLPTKTAVLWVYRLKPSK